MIIGFRTQIMPEMAARTLCPSADQPGSEPNFAEFCKRLWKYVHSDSVLHPRPQHLA
jgi:hypothetical protein